MRHTSRLQAEGAGTHLVELVGCCKGSSHDRHRIVTRAGAAVCEVCSVFIPCVDLAWSFVMFVLVWARVGSCGLMLLL